MAEFVRRRPDPAAAPAGPGRMPGVWGEHAGAELAVQLHLTPGAAEGLLSLAHDLAVKLPGTAAALRDGIIDLEKARTIAWYCFALTPAEGRAAEKILLGLAGVEEMTWGMIRDRIARAVIEVNPGAARRRREEAAKDKRVEVVAEQSGNCQLAGRELPPAAVLAADENLTGRARQLRAAGLKGGMDELRALAYLEALGGLDPLDGVPGGVSGGADPGGGTGGTGDGTGNGTEGGPGSGGDGGPGSGGPRPGTLGGPGRGGTGEIPAGFAARVNLTIPLATLLGLAERPGMLSRTGPVDPDPGANTPDRYRAVTWTLVESGVAVDLFAQLRVPVWPHVPVLKGLWSARQGRVRGAHRIVLERPSSSCGEECCNASLVAALRPGRVGLSENRNLEDGCHERARRQDRAGTPRQRPGEGAAQSAADAA